MPSSRRAGEHILVALLITACAASALQATPDSCSSASLQETPNDSVQLLQSKAKVSTGAARLASASEAPGPLLQTQRTTDLSGKIEVDLQQVSRHGGAGSNFGRQGDPKAPSSEERRAREGLDREADDFVHDGGEGATDNWLENYDEARAKFEWDAAHRPKMKNSTKNETAETTTTAAPTEVVFSVGDRVNASGHVGVVAWGPDKSGDYHVKLNNSKLQWFERDEMIKLADAPTTEAEVVLAPGDRVNASGHVGKISWGPDKSGDYHVKLSNGKMQWFEEQEITKLEDGKSTRSGASSLCSWAPVLLMVVLVSLCSFGA